MSHSDTHIRTATRLDAAELARLGARNGSFNSRPTLVAHDGHEIIGGIDLTSTARTKRRGRP